MKSLGLHILAEYKACDSEVLNDIQKIESLLLKAAKKAKVTILGSSFHRFEPQGVSGVVVLSESHLSIHTWPEHLYAAVDIFTCGENVEPKLAFDFLKEALSSKNASYELIHRGKLS